MHCIIDLFQIKQTKMINSSYCNVKTPQKKFISSKEVVPINIADKSDKGRFSPSKDMMKLLEGLDRVHLFQFHKEVVLVELTEMPFLSVKVTKDLGEFFRRESPDIPDVIHNLETIAVTDGYYSSFLKYFVAEEFSNPEEYSFSILTVLNYMHAFSISLQDALLEIFQLASHESVCELCIESPGKDKKLVSKQCNFLLLQRKITEQPDDDDDDSLVDADYKPKSLDSSSEVDVYEFVDSGSFEAFNPFASNSFERESMSKLPSIDSDMDKNLNSTMAFNPFSNTGHTESESGAVGTYKVLNDKVACCPYCGKSFKSNYNMKQHVISVHKILVQGIKVYKCSIKNCSFVTGSRVQFNRHNHHDSKTKKEVDKPVCTHCQVVFANSSSLKRHLKRLHKGSV